MENYKAVRFALLLFFIIFSTHLIRVLTKGYIRCVRIRKPDIYTVNNDPQRTLILEKGGIQNVIINAKNNKLRSQFI